MRKKYLLPQQKIVEIEEEESFCQTSGSMKVVMKDYETYEDESTPRTDPNSVNWDGVGTGSDF